MRTLSGGMTAATAATITRPGYLVEIAFSSPARFSSIGDVLWSGQAWSGARSLSVSGLSDTGGRLTLGNADDALAGLILNDGIAGRSIKIWAADAAALAADDPVLVFDGVGDAAEVSTESASITLAASDARTLFSPRRFVGLSAGFTQLIPAGTTMQVGNVKLTLDRS